MGFCSNCGKELPNGSKFCTNCGKSMEGNSQQNWTTAVQYQAEVLPQNKPKKNILDRFGFLYGILLLILAYVDYHSDPAIVTIILSVGILAGCIFCFKKKYKLKLFTILAFFLALVCLLCGFVQSKQIGLFKIPKSNIPSQNEIQTSVVSNNTQEPKPVVTQNPITQAESKTSESPETDILMEQEEVTSQETEEESSEEPEATEASEESSEESEKDGKINGVDPDLKEFLDGYEAFMDDYVAFMKKYSSNSGNVFEMLADYTEMMLTYEEWATKLDEYDADTMSTEDAKYYLDVINRCNKKMLEIY